ncbi:unnamed protein product, partial [Hapterophycus canaliculatus]
MLTRPLNLNRRVEKWASCVHPGLHTLGIASTQRVESMNAAVKNLVTRAGNMVDLNRALHGKVQDDANKTRRRSEGGRETRVPLRNVSSMENVKHHLLKHFSFVLDALEHEKCSRHAVQDTEAQVVAALGYNATLLVRGEDEARGLLDKLADDPYKAKLLYDTSSGELMDPSRPTTTADGVSMVSRTSVPHFADILRDQRVDAVVRITMITPASEFDHLVALGPDGFFLCTCLRQLVHGLLCPNGIKALWHQEIDRFNGASIAPRWRESDTRWPMAALAAKPARLSAGAAESADLRVFVDPNPIVSSSSGPNVRAYAYANGVALGKELGGMFKEITSMEGIHRTIETIKTFAQQQIEPVDDLPPGDAGGAGRGGRGGGGRGSTGRGRKGGGG